MSISDRSPQMRRFRSMEGLRQRLIPIQVIESTNSPESLGGALKKKVDEGGRRHPPKKHFHFVRNVTRCSTAEYTIRTEMQLRKIQEVHCRPCLSSLFWKFRRGRSLTGRVNPRLTFSAPQVPWQKFSNRPPDLTSSKNDRNRNHGIQ